MRLPQTAEYAIRVMAYMAMLPEGKPVRSKDLSEATAIPAHYLSKVLRKLVTAGLLCSRKGHQGGFIFAKSKNKIHIIDILDAIQYDYDPEYCMFGWGKCSIHSPCPMHEIWSEMKQNFIDWARKHTLADVKLHEDANCPLPIPA